MRKISNALLILMRPGALSLVVLVSCAATGTHAQTSRAAAGRVYSDSDAAPAASRTRTRTATADDRGALGDTPTDILHAAHTIYISPNQHINSDYLEYKLDKLPEFAQWQLSIVKNRDRADLVLEIKKTALNYIFSIVEPESSIVVAKGKVVAINGRVAAEDISHQIVKRMRAIRALPAN
ncbi:MAG: hypothetical protein QOG71_3981 [Pyrinomonadaceae bacterium]|nr:hypothetical protein [Pyrinomonadaceae bacterium]